MKTFTPENYSTQPGLAARLHAAARRDRARAIGRLLSRLIDKLTPRKPHALSLRWG